jgi:hypothetical protein
VHIVGTGGTRKPRYIQGTLPGLTGISRGNTDTAISSGEWTGAVAIFTDDLFAIRARIRQERHAGNLSRAEEDVGEALCSLIAAGIDDPSWAEIARLAHCSLRTVARAMAKLRRLGIVQSRRRGELRAGRWRRIASQYCISLPAGPVLPRQRCSCQTGGGSKLKKKKGLQRTQEAMARDEALIALAAVRASREQTLAAAWAARKRGAPG